MKHIVLTGGGTAGHVTPNMALIPHLKELGYKISYIGSRDGIEKKLISEMGIPYYGVSTGKLRRYLSLKNVSDPFKVLLGTAQARSVLKKLQPDIVFSKGGFVAVPVVTAASKLHIPAIIHESDMTPGLANRLCFPKAVKVCCNFPETAAYLPADKAVVTGTPIREELMNGSAEKAREFCGFTSDKPVIMAVGGSLGSVAVNNAIRNSLPALLEKYQVIHLCGKDNLDPSLDGTPGYAQYTFIKEELADMFALAELVVSRAGANAICELCALAKPNLLIPLSAAASRGDQLLNAASYEKQGFSKVLKEEEITPERFLSDIEDLYANRETYIANMKNSSSGDAIGTIISLIEENSGAGK